MYAKIIATPVFQWRDLETGAPLSNPIWTSFALEDLKKETGQADLATQLFRQLESKRKISEESKLEGEILSIRNRRAEAILEETSKGLMARITDLTLDIEHGLQLPEVFLCPISADPFVDPILTLEGQTYSKASWAQYVQNATPSNGEISDVFRTKIPVSEGYFIFANNLVLYMWTVFLEKRTEALFNSYNQIKAKSHPLHHRKEDLKQAMGLFIRCLLNVSGQEEGAYNPVSVQKRALSDFKKMGGNIKLLKKEFQRHPVFQSRWRQLFGRCMF